MKWSSQYFHNNYVLVLSRATPGSLYVSLRLDNAAVASWPEVPRQVIVRHIAIKIAYNIIFSVNVQLPLIKLWRLKLTSQAKNKISSCESSVERIPCPVNTLASWRVGITAETQDEAWSWKVKWFFKHYKRDIKLHEKATQRYPINRIKTIKWRAKKSKDNLKALTYCIIATSSFAELHHCTEGIFRLSAPAVNSTIKNHVVEPNASCMKEAVNILGWLRL